MLIKILRPGSPKIIDFDTLPHEIQRSGYAFFTRANNLPWGIGDIFERISNQL